MNMTNVDVNVYISFLQERASVVTRKLDSDVTRTVFLGCDAVWCRKGDRCHSCKLL